MAEKKKLRFSLSTNILIGMFLGIVCGVFFGEKVAFFQVAGNAFIKLLQMTILPYILVSLVNGIGGLTYSQAVELAKKRRTVAATILGHRLCHDSVNTAFFSGLGIIGFLQYLPGGDTA